MNPLGKLIIAGILVLTTSLVHPQQADSLRVDQLLREASALRHTDPDSAFIIAKDAYAKALNLDNSYLQARCNCLFGNLFWDAGRHDQSLELYFKSLPFYESIPPGEKSAEVMSQWVTLLAHITVSYFELEMFDKAHEYVQRSQKALHLADKHRPGAVSARNRMYLLFNFGSLYIESEEYDKAQNMLSEVQQINDIAARNLQQTFHQS